jgi:hypothetical protein
MESLYSEMIEQCYLAVDDICKIDPGESGAVRLSSRRVRRGRAGRPVATPNVVDAYDGDLARVEGFAGSDEGVPPTRVNVFVPLLTETGNVIVETGRVLAAAQRVEDENRVGTLFIQIPVDLIGKGQRSQPASIVKSEAFVERGETRLDPTD